MKGEPHFPPQTVFAMKLLLKIALTIPAVFALYYLLLHIEPVDAEQIVLTREHLPLASEVYDRHGIKIGEFAQEKRYFVPLQEMPRYLVEAFLSTEDKGFFAHRGIDYFAALRALWTNISARSIRQGGSTITQQLARMLFLNRQKTWLRKSREAQIAAVLEKKYPKTKILEYYLNSIYLGNGAYGVEAASRIYFRKASRELNLSEAALLAALPKAPSALAPHRNYPAAMQRSRLVLQRMLADNIISPQHYAQVREAAVKVYPHAPRFTSHAPYFNAEVRKVLHRKYSMQALNHRGYQIYTSLDSKLQRRTAARFRQQVAQLRRQQGKELQAAFFVLHARDGDVLAVQGGSAYRVTQFNRALQTRRRAQRMLLPFVLAALSRGAAHHDSNDINPTFVTLYSAILQQQQVDIATLLQQVGAGSLNKILTPFGIELNHAMPALDFTLEQMTAAFAAFANHGYQVKPRYVLRIKASNGKSLFTAASARGARVFSFDAAFIVGEVLRVFAQYHSKELESSKESYLRSYAASSNDLHNAWALGYNTRLSAGIWLGAEYGRMRLRTGQQQASKLFARLFYDVARNNIPRSCSVPSGTMPCMRSSLPLARLLHSQVSPSFLPLARSLKNIAFVSLKVRDHRQQEHYVSLPVPL